MIKYSVEPVKIRIKGADDSKPVEKIFMQKTVQSDDKKSYVMTWLDFQFAVEVLAEQLEELFVSRGKPAKNIYGIPRGGLPLAVALSNHLDIPMIYDKNDVACGTIVVDDISDSGETLKLYEGLVYAIVTLYSFNDTITVPDFNIFTKDVEWIYFPWEKIPKEE